MRAERADSALDHRQRATLTVLYDVPYFKNSSSWLLKNVVGNWEIAPIYTFQSGTWATLQSVTDANLNGDNAGDRVVVNPMGTNNVGSGVTDLTNSAGDVVGYLATNPNARFIRAEAGVYPNASRNNYALPPINNIDVTLQKSFNITESARFELFAGFLNAFNHPQYIGGYLSDVKPTDFTTGSQIRNSLNPANSTFNRPDQVFSSNPRTIQLGVKFVF